MRHEVIMPALGMAQETGLILAWRKKPGDAVEIGDVLMDVETDKAAMEVEAQAAGFLAELRAEEGDDVPVGTVIAVISDSKDAVGGASPKAETPATEPEPVNAGTAPPASAADGPPKPENAAVGAVPEVGTRSAGDRILASPKAKRLARERGLDLSVLSNAGHPQPYRAADIEQFAAERTHATQAATASERIRARARVPADAFDDFSRWLSGEAVIATSALFAAFAGGSFRPVTGLETVAVFVIAPRKQSRIYLDPDRCGLLALKEVEGGAAADLVVYDLTDTRLTNAELAADNAPTLTVSRAGGMFVVSLSANRAQLDDDALIACLDAFAGRLEEPLRQLL